MSKYDLAAMKAPRLAGNRLHAFVLALENPITGRLLSGKLLKDAGVKSYRQVVIDEAPSVRPNLPLRGRVPEEESARAIDLGQVFDAWPEDAQGAGFRFETARDFARAYRDGALTPVNVARRLLEAIAAQSATPVKALIKWDEGDLMKQARASAERFTQGEPLGPLDGVPVAIKDELDMVPFSTSVGTKFLGKQPAREDATVVARLRAAGALLIGKANMHEIGIGVTGLNPHWGTARNPYNPDHHTGGSSSGSAAAVASGLCPIAVGADGGGSIRTPSALCGLVGLKATYGRISEHGAFPLCWSVAHVGPIAASVWDCALSYAVMAGLDSKDPNTRGQPAPHLDGLSEPDLTGLRVGVYPEWYRDADSSVVGACDQALEALKARGATVQEVEIPGLELARVAHVVTITSEMNAAMDSYYREHQNDFGLDVRVSLALTRYFTSRDYIQAQRVRTRFVSQWEALMEDVDVIATPTTGATAPRIKPDALRKTESDISSTGAILRFVFPANLNGFPAISVPAGYDPQGLPIGLQLIGRPWEEHTLFRCARAVEASVERRAPRVYRPLLG